MAWVSSPTWTEATALTVAFSVPKLTLARRTPGTAESAFSMVATQEAQDIPPIDSVSVATGTS